MEFAELKYPKSPIIPTTPIGGGKVKVNGSYREWSLNRPLAGDPHLIVSIQDFGSWIIPIESMVKDILQIAQKEE